MAKVRNRGEYEKKYGQMIRSVRKKAGLKQSDVAKKVGLAFGGAIGSYERCIREPTIAMTMKILSACLGDKYTPDVLFDAFQMLIEEFQKRS